MKRNVANFVPKCLTFQQMKAKHKRPSRLLQPLPILEWKWDHITMNFVVGLPRLQQNHDVIWVIVDHMTKSAHFITYSMTYPVERMSRMYL